MTRRFIMIHQSTDSMYLEDALVHAKCTPHLSVSIRTRILTTALAMLFIACVGLIGCGAADNVTTANNWSELVTKASEWNSPKLLTIVLMNDSTDAYKNTSGSPGSYEGIPIKGNVKIVPKAECDEIKIDANQTGRLFQINSGGSLTIAGNNTTVLNLTNGTINNNAGGGIYLFYGGNLTLQDNVMITNCSAGKGGGVCNFLGTLIMSGGSITNCTAISEEGFGGGVFNYLGTLIMSGGSITNCTTISEQGLGGGVMNSGVFTMSGGNITNCSAILGAGVFTMKLSTFNMSGGNITGCIASYGGSGVAFNGPFTMNNTAQVSEDNDILLIEPSCPITLGDGGFANESNYGAMNIMLNLTSTPWLSGTTIVSGGAVNVSHFNLSKELTDAGYRLAVMGKDLVLTQEIIINTEANLTALAELVNGGNDLTGSIVKVTADIPLLGEWTPIGNETNKFNGTFDGGYHTISNLSINQPEKSYQGLFGYADNGSVIKNVKLDNVSVTGSHCVGALVGETKGAVSNSSSTGSVNCTGYDVGGLIGVGSGAVSNCSATVSVIGTNSCVGGLIGRISDAVVVVSNCSANVSIIGTGTLVGGLIGFINGCDVSNCYATGTVNGRNKVGGLVGKLYNADLSNCYASGVITGTGENVGGLIGLSESGNVNNCYATGLVNGFDSVGGLIGYIWKDSGVQRITVNNCYATGFVNGTNNNSGGLIGYVNDGIHVRNSFALNEKVTGITNVGRVVGDVNESGSTISDCYGWNQMTINGKTVAAGGLNGTDVTSDKVWDTFSGGIWTTAGFIAENWKANSDNDNFKLPVLKSLPYDIKSDASHLKYEKPQPIPPTVVPTQSHSGGGSTNTGAGHYTEYMRPVSNTDSISFGTSQVVSSVDLSNPTSGTVTVYYDTDAKYGGSTTYSSEYSASEGTEGAAYKTAGIKGAPVLVSSGKGDKSFHKTFRIESQLNDGKITDIYFKVAKSDLSSNGVTKIDVILYHGLVDTNNKGEWIPLDTYLTGEDNTYCSYKAETDGTSPFAVVFMENMTIIDEGKQEPVPTQTSKPTTQPTTVVTTVKTTTPTSSVPTATATQTAKSPLALAGVLAGLGAAFAIGMRRRE